MIFSGIPGTAVTISGGMGTPIPNSEQETINAYIAANGGSQDIYTVPAGQEFYLMGACIEGGAAVATTLTVLKDDGATQVLIINTGVQSGNQSFSSSVPIWKYAAGEDVKIIGTNTYKVNVWGVLV